MYVSLGTTTPAVIVIAAHGLNLTHLSWEATVADLHRQIPHAAVITYDHRGHGDREPGTAPLSLDVLADDLLAVIADARSALGPLPVQLVGHSLGGMVVATALLRGRIDGLAGVTMVASSSGCFTGGGLLRCLPSLAAKHPEIYAKAQHLIRGALTPVIGARASNVGTELNPVVGAQLLGVLGGYNITEALATAWKTYWAALPCAILVGDGDRITPPAHSEVLRSMSPLAALTVLPGLGHDLPTSAPGAIATAVANLIERTLACSPSPQNTPAA